MKPIVPLAIITFICFTFFSNTRAQINTADKPANDPELEALIDEFFQKYQNDSPSDAIDFIFATNPTFPAGQVEQVRTKLDTTNQLIGNFYGWELITTRQTTPSLVFYSYLVKHDLQPLRFSFMFYKPKDQWLLYKFKFDDQVDAELEE